MQERKEKFMCSSSLLQNSNMCGIFGYVGRNNDTPQMVLEGLKLLEYRGYDSWGIAVQKDDKVIIDKHTGKIGLAKTTLPQSTIGIGHTRWATHGGVTVENAHPHTDCNKEIAVVHNGIVENYITLKNELISLNHTFLSDTDTEVIAHLIEENLNKHEFSEAVRVSFKRLEGLSAIVVIDPKTHTLVAAKNGSPLVIGIGADEFFVASDAVGIIPHTKNVVFLEDNQMVILSSSSEFKEIEAGNGIKPEVTKLSWVFEDAEKGEHKHFFIKEIYEEPKVIENIALHSLSNVKKLTEDIEKAFGTFLIACGSASYAALAATYLFAKVSKKHVNFAVGSEFKYLEDFISKKTLIIPISQSGESIDVIEPITRVKKQKKAKIAAVVNVLGSTLYRMADTKVLLGAGPEKAVVATKSFIAMLAVIFLASYTLSGKEKEGVRLLHKASRNVSRLLEHSYIEKIKLLADKLKNKEHVYVIGRGLSYAAALEATLKLKEAAYVHAEAFPGGELKHGVIALIEKETPCIVFAPNDETYGEIISNAQEIKARGGYIIGIGPLNHPVFDEFLETEDLKEATILPQVTISHLLGYYTALARGIEDPDKPRNLAKSVTVK